MTGNSGILEPLPAIGAGAMLINTVLILVMGVTVKTLAHMDVPTLEMLTWRAVVMLLLLLPLLVKAEHRRAVRAADIKAHLVQPARGCLDQLFGFCCIFQLLPCCRCVFLCSLLLLLPVLLLLVVVKTIRNYRQRQVKCE